jgi:hypothetical protein
MSNPKIKYYYYLIIFFYFFSFFTIGILTAKDYGIHIEEKFHRSNGFYWLNYVLSFTNLNNLKEISLIKFKSISDYTLSSVAYYNKYGIIFDVPAALIEILFNINEPKKFYQLRHILSFIIFFISTIFFFKILLNRFKNINIAILGTTFYILSPRIYGDSFLYKDILFLSICTISIYSFFKVIDNFNYRNLIFFALFSSLATSTRIIGIFLPIMFLIITFLEILYRKPKKDFIVKNILCLLLFFLFLIIHWPYLWSSPFNNFLSVFKSIKTDLVNIKILFNGIFISNEFIPYSYLPRWIVISTPTIHIILFLIGYYFIFKRFLIKFIKIEECSKNHDLWHSLNEKKDFIIFISLSSIFLFCIINNVKLYNGWRLLYFLNIFFVYIITYCIYLFFIKIRLKNKIVYLNLFFAISFLIIVQRMALYHPYQSLYFNGFLSKENKNSYEGDYYGLSTSKAILEILKKDKEAKEENKIINIGVASHTPLQRGIEFIDINKKDLVRIVGQEFNSAKYIYKNNISEVDINYNKKYNIPENFKKIDELIVDGIIIYEIYKNLKIK